MRKVNGKPPSLENTVGTTQQRRIGKEVLIEKYRRDNPTASDK
jgi:hypothetical protein